MVFAGESGVGKTSLVRTLAGDDVRDGGHLPPTTAIDCRHVLVTAGQLTVNMCLVDLPGGKRYRSLTRFAYQNADVVCLLYNSGSLETLQALASDWLARDIPCATNRRGPGFVLVRVNHFADSVDYLSVEAAVAAVVTQCDARSGMETPHVCVCVDYEAASRAWDVRRLVGAVLDCVIARSSGGVDIDAEGSEPPEGDVHPPGPLPKSPAPKPTSPLLGPEHVTSLRTFDEEHPHCLDTKTKTSAWTRLQFWRRSPSARKFRSLEPREPPKTTPPLKMEMEVETETLRNPRPRWCPRFRKTREAAPNVSDGARTA